MLLHKLLESRSLMTQTPTNVLLIYNKIVGLLERGSCKQEFDSLCYALNIYLTYWIEAVLVVVSRVLRGLTFFSLFHLGSSVWASLLTICYLWEVKKIRIWEGTSPNKHTPQLKRWIMENFIPNQIYTLM